MCPRGSSEVEYILRIFQTRFSDKKRRALFDPQDILLPFYRKDVCNHDSREGFGLQERRACQSLSVLAENNDQSVRPFDPMNVYLHMPDIPNLLNCPSGTHRLYERSDRGFFW